MHSNRASSLEHGHGGPGAIRSGSGLEQLLTIAEVAQLLRVSEKSVRRMVVHRRIPCVRVGRLVRFVSGDVLRWLSARKEG